MRDDKKSSLVDPTTAKKPWLGFSIDFPHLQTFVTANCWFFSYGFFVVCFIHEEEWLESWKLFSRFDFLQFPRSKAFPMNFFPLRFRGWQRYRRAEACLWNANMQIMNNWIVRLWGVDWGEWERRQFDQFFMLAGCIVGILFFIYKSDFSLVLDECSLFTLDYSRFHAAPRS